MAADEARGDAVDVLFWLAVAIVVGTVFGRASGGRLVRLGSWRPSRLAVLASALGLQLPLVLLPPMWRSFALVLSLSLLGAWFIANCCTADRRLRVGLGALALGFAMNSLCIAANGAMPVSAAALRASGLPMRIVQSFGNHAKHQVSARSTRLLWLGDSIGIRFLHAVISLGDVLMLVGIASTVALLMLAPEANAGKGVPPRVSNSDTQLYVNPDTG